MLCPECGSRPATFHFTKIVNGKKAEFHLCEHCAQEHGESIPVFENGLSFHQLLSGLLNFELSPSGQKETDFDVVPEGRCETCGLTYNQFGKVGRFGCADCYSAFKDRLTSLLRRVHGNTKHRGKIPERTKGELKLVRELASLKEDLAIKISQEKFEEAAVLRDQIRELQDKIEGRE
jgi:protein arginine kinase activator